jgi:predicted Zn-dependent protease
MSSWRQIAFRTGMIALALAAAAWFALGIRQAHELTTVSAQLARSPRLSAAQARSADALLDAAGTLNPDKQVALLRGQVALAAGGAAAAQRIFLQLARGEPMNINAWAWLVRAAGSDHRLIRLGLEHIAQLSPKVPAS